jgi:hypothetical protein
VNVSGFTESGNNIFAGVLQSVAAGKIIIALPEGDEILEESAGDSVTITKWETRRTTAQDIADLGGGGGGGSVAVDDEGTEVVATATRINFAGAGVEVTDGGSGEAVVTISGAAAPAVTETFSSPSYNLTNGDSGKYQRWTNTGAKTLTVRPNSTHAITQDAEFYIANRGSTGALTITEGSGVTVNPPAGGTLVLDPGMVVTIKRVAEDLFDLIGQTVAA